MSSQVRAAVHAKESLAPLKDWLIQHAYSLWWTCGADRVNGGFHERLTQSGAPTGEPRRGRVHPRQIYSYARAQELGWRGPAQTAVAHGLEFFVRHYLRSDGLFRTLVAPDGKAVDDRAVLYDQAFALLGFAYAYKCLQDESLQHRARDLLDVMRVTLSHPRGGFEEMSSHVPPLLSNSHMHLLEASLAWADLDPQGPWRSLAEEIIELAMTRFIDPVSGFVLEFFDRNWRPAAGSEGRIVEPGHQYEWAWLLLTWNRTIRNARVHSTAINLISLAELYGWDAKREVVVNTLLSDKNIYDGRARLWPQTEKMKAMSSAALATGDERYWSGATAAVRALGVYLNRSGLWLDEMNLDGSFVDGPAPASSLYHIVCAISVMDRALASASPK